MLSHNEDNTNENMHYLQKTCRCNVILSVSITGTSPFLGVSMTYKTQTRLLLVRCNQSIHVAACIFLFTDILSAFLYFSTAQSSPPLLPISPPPLLSLVQDSSWRASGNEPCTAECREAFHLQGQGPPSYIYREKIILEEEFVCLSVM